MFSNLLDPDQDPFVKGTSLDPDPFYQANARKTFIPTVCTVWCFATSLRLLILEK
jgi:hypothetical protein